MEETLELKGEECKLESSSRCNLMMRTLMKKPIVELNKNMKCMLKNLEKTKRNYRNSKKQRKI
jgi:hypothetical protein